MSAAWSGKPTRVYLYPEESPAPVRWLAKMLLALAIAAASVGAGYWLSWVGAQ